MEKLTRCTGIIMLSPDQNSVLLGRRSDGQGWALPGGKLDRGESFEIAAVREFKEETGALPIDLASIGVVSAEALVRVNGERKEFWVCPTIFVSTVYEGTIAPTEEMLEFKWVRPVEAAFVNATFPPTRASLQRFLQIFPEVRALKQPVLGRIGL